MIFISLDYSPWSEKARWSLDHSGIQYTPKPYVSMIGAPWLRYKTKQHKGPVTVPVLIDDKTVLNDSFDIAFYANSKRTDQAAKDLFPCKQKALEWNELSEKALSIGRYFCVERQLGNKLAQIEILPSFIPLKARHYFTWLARNGLQYHLDKYKVQNPNLSQFRDILLKLREQLNGRETILEEFSYCDIAMSLTLQYVKPVAYKYSAQGPASAKCWSTSELFNEFKDLIEWRDSLYQVYR
jgi:glutathione S-transferase